MNWYAEIPLVLIFPCVSWESRVDILSLSLSFLALLSACSAFCSYDCLRCGSQAVSVRDRAFWCWWWSTHRQSWSCLASQEQVTAAVAHAVEQQMQKLLEETQLDMNEFDNLLQPIIDTCTKDAISVRAGGPGWAGCAQNLVLLTGENLLKPMWAGAALGAPSLPLPFRLEHLQKGEGRQSLQHVAEPLGTTPLAVP